jgi:hypothetical protein
VDQKDEDNYRKPDEYLTEDERKELDNIFGKPNGKPVL